MLYLANFIRDSHRPSLDSELFMARDMNVAILDESLEGLTANSVIPVTCSSPSKHQTFNLCCLMLGQRRRR